MSIHARFSLARGNSFRLTADLELPARGVTAIFGQSGSGKTTLLRCIAGLERPDHGHLRLGKNIWQDDAQRIFVPTHQRPLGYVFQHAALFDHLNVAANIDYGMKRVRSATRRVQRDNAIDLLGLGPLLELPTTALSGGERQRVGMARALLTSPSLLLMDEPLAALDERSKRDILPYLERLHRELEIPVLYVSHSVDEVARLADHVVVMQGGRVQGSGPVMSMLSAPGLALARDELAASVVAARVMDFDAGTGLSRLRTGIGELRIPQRLVSGEEHRLRIRARDVAIALEAPTRTSILNCLPVIIQDMQPHGEHELLLRLGTEGRLLAMITRYSSDQLSLATGQHVYALIKSAAVEA